jgi:hypothetical protein
MYQQLILKTEENPVRTNTPQTGSNTFVCAGTRPKFVTLNNYDADYDTDDEVEEANRIDGLIKMLDGLH